MIKQNEELMIFIVTHKIIEFYKDKNFYPILVGAENSNLDMSVKDNFGNNISLKNKNFCELTALYWIWKNINSKYIGICHYRRYFNELNKNICNYKNINNRNIKLSKENIESLLENYDLILPSKYELDSTVKENYEKYHRKEDLEKIGKIIKEKYENSYFQNWDIVLNKNYLYPYNMMICKKEIFDKYCAWLFDILFELEKRIVIPNDSYQARVFGFLSERLMLLYIMTNKLEIKEINVTKLETTKEIFKIKIKKMIKIFLFWRK